ncbi:LysR family transcriptional regulator [Noviherbaspirillum cavernae]|uniref:LysR family transcriptional regulator n=1 Tax=Noviherbaspirillum cavernae TaxID=2320862 RepID=A0A418X4P1_9BURK|nr:LysR family transcriptional regulator [Noviherbaspirillum cavernae]RJG07379.1 LysR family transcriptional regulator [Noviherbaspirillum cavernae]
MQDLNDLYYYAQVVDHGGFAPAGRALGMPKSTLSRRIALLEERLGVRLIQRSTRHFSVTEIGQTYYEHCKAMLMEAEAAQEAIEVTQAEPRGIVRMTCPIALLHANVGAMLADFMAAHPRVTVHLEATNRRVDPVSEAIDVALRVRPPPLQDSELVMRVLADRGQCLLASPALLARHPAPHAPADLADWPSLALGTPQQSHLWSLFGPDGAHAAIHHTPRFVTGDMIALIHAALAGVGVVQLPTMFIRPQLAQGSLVPLLPEWAPRREIVHAVFPSRRGLLPSVRSLIEYLAQRFAALDED